VERRRGGGGGGGGGGRSRRGINRRDSVGSSASASCVMGMGDQQLEYVFGWWLVVARVSTHPHAVGALGSECVNSHLCGWGCVLIRSLPA
jgi:hypothetical protein